MSNNIRLVATNHKRTQYAIRDTFTGLWLNGNLKWDTKEAAVRYDFMTTALGLAVDCGFALNSFTVEAV